MEEYFRRLDEETTRAYAVASKARELGIDPETRVEIPRAKDLASRVEKLLSKWKVDGIAERIRTLAQGRSREEVALTMAEEIALDPKWGTVADRLDVSLRVGLAILTEGIVVAPLEGLVKTEIHPDPAGDYVDLYYAGPIRAAGGGAQALSVLLADLVRQRLGLAAWRASEAEVGRYCEELPLYKHLQHLQYSPSVEEIRWVVSHLPVCIDGEATEGDQEVSAFRNLPRVGTNGIRGGACLVIAEGLCLKAPKVLKIVDRLKLPGWEFLQQVGKKGSKEDEGKDSLPKYLAEAVGGRPVLGYPHRPGGFRLVYGRCRTTGLAACGVNPATMVLLRHFVAIGTQVKTELPGKAAAMAVCDTVEGPLALLDDGSYVEVHDAERAEELLPRVQRIIDLGELLVSFGEFLENNRPLVPGAYSLPWHLELLRAAGSELGRRAVSPTWEEALEDARRWGVPIHPRFNLFWHDLEPGALPTLSRRVETEGEWDEGTLSLPREPDLKEQLLLLGALHREEGEWLVLHERVAPALLLGLGLEVDPKDGQLKRRAELRPPAGSTLEEVGYLSGVLWKPRAPTRVGARVGRPEKAHQRVMQPNVHVLFPVAEAGGPKRSVPVAAERAREIGRSSPERSVASRPAPSSSSPRPSPLASFSVAIGVRRCPQCGQERLSNRCPCGAHTEPTERTHQGPLPFQEIWESATRSLELERAPPEVKGVKGLMSEGKTPEPVEKGVLRAMHRISVYQDGTARFDLTDLPLTHFRPREVGLSLERARELGYVRDWSGEPLTREDQLLEVLPHDIIVARSCGEYLLALSHFLDDELVRLYGQEPFYRARRPEDLFGQLVIALAPHTSGGVLGRIVGYTEVEGCFAHPVFHAAKRRNCDGDEDSVTLLLDGLLNFSFAYLPVKRGALMDKPLVLTTRLDSREVDKEAHSLDVAYQYPLALYQAAERGLSPKDVEKSIDTLGKRLEQGALQVSQMGFTHDTTDIGGGPHQSAYRESHGMERTVEETLLLGAQLRAVDMVDAVGLLLNHHFLPDIMGNLKSYATQKFRCKACGESVRRPPLDGRCPAPRGKDRCGGELMPTVYPNSVAKYLRLSRSLAHRYEVSPYLRQRVEILESSFTSLFPSRGKGVAGLEQFEVLEDPAPGPGPGPEGGPPLPPDAPTAE